MDTTTDIENGSREENMHNELSIMQLDYGLSISFLDSNILFYCRYPLALLPFYSQTFSASGPNISVTYLHREINRKKNGITVLTPLG